METTKLLYTRKEAAQCLSLSVRTVDTLTATKQLPTRRIGRRVLIPAHALAQFARRNHPEVE
jgi:excisionase family DNA binding protein